MAPEQLDGLVVRVQHFARAEGQAWAAIVTWARARIDVLRDALELETAEVKCAEIRGEIRGLRTLLALPGTVTRVEQAGPGEQSVGDDNW
jgi:hypothetical protein